MPTDKMTKFAAEFDRDDGLRLAEALEFITGLAYVAVGAIAGGPDLTNQFAGVDACDLARDLNRNYQQLIRLRSALRGY